MTATRTSSESGRRHFLAAGGTSPAIYASVIVVSAVLGRWLQYLSAGEPWLKGQPASVIVQGVGFLLAVALWLFASRSRSLGGLGASILVLLAISWAVHMALAFLHGDSFYHLAWLYLPVLLMLWWKPLSEANWRVVLLTLSLSLAVVLLATLILEQVGLLALPYMDPGLVSFEMENYWLPLADLLGIPGRWQGPFGHSGDTGAYSALLLVLAVGFRSKWSWFTAPVALLGLTLTSVRVAYIAALVGVAVVILFGRSPWIRRIPVWLRLGISALGVVGVTFVMFGQSSSLSGRSTNIWPAFWDLWLVDPIVGAGGAGIAQNGGVTELSVHAHNLFLDDLVRNGVLGFALQMAAVCLAIGVLFAAMIKGLPGPMAVAAAYLVIGITQVMNDWLHPSIPVLMLLALFLMAHAHLQEVKRRGSSGLPDRV